MAILTNPGRASIAASVLNETIHMAWGRGAESWDTNLPLENIDATSLLAEFGRRKVTQANFCNPNPSGTIVVPSGRFSISATPTKYLYLRFSFDFLDSADEIIREVGVFTGTVPKSSVPANQEYLVPSQIENFGSILTIQHLNRIDRSDTIRQQFEFVIQF